MDILIIVLLSIYFVCFLSYVYVVKLGRNYFRAANKCVLALIYLAISIIAFVTNALEYKFIIALIVGLGFTFLGDIVLMLKFDLGAGLFTFGNISILISELLMLDYYNVKFLYYCAFIIIAFILCHLYKLYLKNSNLIRKDRNLDLAIGYLFFVTLHGVLSIFSLFILKNNFIIVFSIGSILFMISDYILVKHTYSINPKLLDQRINTICYFIGIMMICCSIFLI